MKAQGEPRCGGCHAIAAWVWILGVSTVAWAGSIALYVMVSRLMFPDVARVFAALGADLPLPARIYLVVSAWLLPAVIFGVVGAPIVAAIMGQRAPDRLRTWARRYALSVIFGVAWGLLGVAAWYRCAIDTITALE
jgi:hypothetical protein